MSSTLVTAGLAEHEFERIRRFLYRVCGIDLRRGKEELVRSRLGRRLAALGLDDFTAYLDHLEADASGQEAALMVDLLTTNKTSFFREAAHFDFLRARVLPRLAAGGGAVRLWSAGCSSGEEPYSIAMLLREEFPDVERRDVRVLATDISARVLALARAGVYARSALRDVPPALLGRHFAPAPGRSDAYRAGEGLRALVRFARLNLMEPWPMRGPFDVIFCRNVMIYFDRTTQEQLIGRFWELLPPGGVLFVGHAESLSSLSHRFRYVQPAVYEK